MLTYVINIGEWLRRWAYLTPDKTAIIFEDEPFTYAYLNRQTNRIANMLTSLEVKKGDRVGVLLYNSLYYPEILFALAKLGAVLVPLNWRLRSGEMEYVLKDSGVKTLFFGEDFANVVDELRRSLSIGKDHYLCVGSPPGWAVSLEETIGLFPDDEPQLDELPGNEDPVIIMYTSGTTGQPKGAVLSHRKTFFNALNADIYYGLTPSDIMLAPRPMFHSGGLLVELCPVIYKGGTLVMRRRFTPEEILRSIEKHRVTILEISATQLRFIMEQCDLSKYDLSSLKVCYTGGERVPVDLLEEYARRGIIISQIFGQTETSTITWLNPKDAIRKRGSVGKPVFFSNVRIVNEDGKDIRPGEVGEIIVKDYITMNGYWGKKELTEEVMKDGWLHTGDLATVDEEGFIYIVDRLKDMFISGGENVYPAEIEKVLMEHPKIIDAGVCGIPDEKWGEKGLACIVLKEGEKMTEEEVISFLEGRLARYKIPKVIRFVESLPRNAADKILRRKLREEYLRGLREKK